MYLKDLICYNLIMNYDWRESFNLHFKKGKNGLYNCSCCGNYTMDDYDLWGHICPVCFWQYCLSGQEDPDRVIGGPNYELSLNMAKKNFQQFGAIAERHIKNVRKPLPEELPENN